MTSRLLFPTLALAALSFLVGCGGGTAEDSADKAQVANIGGIGGSGATAQNIGGIGGSGATAQNIGGIGGSGVTAQNIGGIGGSGITAQNIGGIGGSGIQSAAATASCSLQAVNVTIAGARVNADALALPGSDGWVELPAAAPVRVDLLQLPSGAALPLAFGALPDGTYRQLRLLLVTDDASQPLADSVVTAQGETPLSVPGAGQGGLPLAATLTVAGGQATVSARGLDVCQAVQATAGTYALDAVASGAVQVASTY